MGTRKLTKKELTEPIFVTIGRVRGCIKSYKIEDALMFLDKVFNDASDMDLKIMHLEREARQKEDLK